ncbi:coiled-coil domain-containing protein 82 [Apteryx mantelli]|uniref:Coiled-coil domain-containing protein 82 n=1 Tax=Apteryx mantelli TaxID=2696672 RepID=A0A8B7JK73_9AVES|nr:PREDICTED: coiled-coil domain-containing protein 82 [Apteryx mantelli mantelli]XP_013811476.1 PREDICTED: coiled-coil domain-containing protein 82 [Apteryx mantelli mantelli]XP_013811477.1 PREDICTED: coiled-coil domain-containing protein 82 [Apteryx mantelli mantelli]XP_013811479.1 PREDICTED: coiled-coil domain-containing protein 82 [Apteryx mantelli mantelli]XP_025925175.1 coiled-coil domain-containing protein 82 isoform X1 [Apteryx rowi]XP_025925177.1 coiled-coil domain-containing protein 
MEIKAAVKRYETRKKTGGTELASKSRVDWRRTKREIILFDSDEESSFTSDDEGSVTSEEEVDEKDEIVAKNSPSDPEEKSHNEAITEDAEDEHVMPGKRKRSSTSVLYDSDESEDSDILVRKVFAKRHCIMDEDESSQEQQPDKTCLAENISTNRKQQVLAKLKELARQRATRTSCNSECCEDSNDEVEIEEEPLSHLPLTPTEGSETDNDSMKDFIVDDDDDDEEEDDDDTEDRKSENQPQQKELDISNSQLLAYYVPHLSRCGHYVHFQRIVKAFLINAIDDTFLNSLYDGTRQKKYAQDMLTSLHYLDDRFIQPRLENLISRSRWKDRYKERVDCYPDVRIIMKNPKSMSCQACELNRYCKFDVLLSGKLYNSRTLEADDFMSHDKQVLKVGTVCANRTRVYHNLKHFKYKLYVDCSSMAQLDGVEDEPVKDTVERLFSQLEGSGWIQKRYDDLENCMNDADSFQEEKMD